MKYISTLITKINAIIDDIDQGFRANKLELNPDKTSSIPFGSNWSLSMGNKSSY